jgi:hypothetical protein
MFAAVGLLVAIELLTGMPAAASSASASVDLALLVPQLVAVGLAGEGTALLVRCLAASGAERPKAAELYQALCRG